MIKYLYEYYRLSLEDENQVESNSITSQRQIVKHHISTIPELANIPSIEIVDDGHTGTNFNRPGMTKLLDAARRGEVACIVVKDLSRFGRKFLEASKYIEQLFPYLGIRFISIGDGYDSDTHKGTTANLDIPVRNMLNALYSKDVSKKVKPAKRTQAQQGKCINAYAFYGYKKYPKDKHKLIIDEPAAKVIRRVFELTCEGKTPKQIADIFNAEGILTPYLYKKETGSNFEIRAITSYVWTRSSIAKMLRDERYLGIFIGGKAEIYEVGSGKCVQKPKSEWIRVPGAIPAIIAQELWDEAATLRSHSKQEGVKRKLNSNRMLYRRVRCGYCGRTMRYRTEHKHNRYSCVTVNYTDEFGCCYTKYYEDDIVTVAKTVILSQISVLLDLKKVAATLRKSSKKNIVTAKNTIEGLDSEIEKLQVVKRKLYERYKKGSLDKTAYFKERKVVEDKISSKAAEREKMDAQTIEHNSALNETHHFLDSFARSYTDEESTAEVVNALVEYVSVFSKDRIEIKFSFADKLKEALRALNKAM